MQPECGQENCDNHNCHNCGKEDAAITELERCEGCALVCRWVAKLSEEKADD